MGRLIAKVALEKVRFFAYHGYYPEEQLTGTEFLVDVEVDTEMTGSGGDELTNTVNYERLLEIVTDCMRNTKKLLETVAHSILETVRAEFPEAILIRVAIRKKNLPVKAELENSLVQLTFTR
jgi:7,8-dihydroneopterin aldolase/epimerase/oxygenase